MSPSPPTYTDRLFERPSWVREPAQGPGQPSLRLEPGGSRPHAWVEQFATKPCKPACCPAHESAESRPGRGALGIPSLSAWCTFLLQERAWRCNWAAGELRGLQLGCGTWVVSALPARPEPAAPAGLEKPGAITGSGGAQSTQQAAGARPRAPCPACTAQVPTTSLFAWAGTALPAPPPVRFLHRYLKHYISVTLSLNPTL